MPRFYNRKVEIRFEDSAIEQIDEVAANLGLSRAEYIRKAVAKTVGTQAPLESSASSIKRPISTKAYHSLVQHVYRNMGGSIARIQVESCVAIALKFLL
jgi:metal-responsive CopG/Arc/MetJ family transcriptional regulator